MEEEPSSWDAGGYVARGRASMASTHWTVVRAAGAGSASEHRQAFGALYTAYLPPLLTYLRRKGYANNRAMDLLQGFFEHLLESHGLSKVEPTGRFRSWLLKSLNNFIKEEWARTQTQKRGGGKVHLPIGPVWEEGEVDPQDVRLSPEEAYDRQWAITLLNLVLAKLASEYAADGQQERFAELKRYLSGKDGKTDYTAVGGRLHMKPAAVAKAVERLRRRYADLLRGELSDTTDPGMVEEEWRHLQMAIAGR